MLTVREVFIKVVGYASWICHTGDKSTKYIVKMATNLCVLSH